MKTVNKYKFIINLLSERYCFKCHTIKNVKEFTKIPLLFKNAGVCKECENKR